MTSARQISEWTGWITLVEIDYLDRLARSLKANHTIKIVNIGAGHAISGLTFRRSRSDAVLYTIDINPGESPLGGLGNEIKNMQEEGLDKENYYPIVGDSKIVGKEWSHGKVDMVFVDGDHSYKGAKSDIKIWLNHLRPNGVMAIHDYARHGIIGRGTNDPNDLFPEVIKAVDELLVNRYMCLGRVDRIIAFRKVLLP